MNPEMRRLAEALFNEACYEACTEGYVGEEILTAARDQAITIILRVCKAQRTELRKEMAR